jgi:hypothetical protein
MMAFVECSLSIIVNYEKAKKTEVIEVIFYC